MHTFGFSAFLATDHPIVVPHTRFLRFNVAPAVCNNKYIVFCLNASGIVLEYPRPSNKCFWPTYSACCAFSCATLGSGVWRSTWLWSRVWSLLPSPDPKKPRGGLRIPLQSSPKAKLSWSIRLLIVISVSIWCEKGLGSTSAEHSAMVAFRLEGHRHWFLSFRRCLKCSALQNWFGYFSTIYLWAFLLRSFSSVLNPVTFRLTRVYWPCFRDATIHVHDICVH